MHKPEVGVVVMYVGLDSGTKRFPLRRGSAGVRILYTYVPSSGDICYDNWSYVVVVR